MAGQPFPQTLNCIRCLADPGRAHEGRSPCQYRNRCIRGCPFGGYFSSNSSTLPAAERTGNLTLRPSFPFAGVPVPNGQGGWEKERGFGDIVLLGLWGRAEASGLLWGAGGTSVFPTASKESLGANQWQLGPAALVGWLQDWGVLGGLWQHWWGLNSRDGEEKANKGTLQLFYWFSLAGGWQVGGSPIPTANYLGATTEFSVPINLGVAKSFAALGSLVVNNMGPNVASTLLRVEDRLDQQLMRLTMPAEPEAEPDISPEEQEDFSKVAESVMRECIINLARIKETVSQSFASKAPSAGLDSVPSLIGGIKAGLLMLDKTRAKEVVDRIGDLVRELRDGRSGDVAAVVGDRRGADLRDVDCARRGLRGVCDL